MAKSVRKTTISFGMISIPVELFKVQNNTAVKLKRLCTCGAAPKAEIACGACGETYGAWWGNVPNRGYEVSKGQYLVITDDEVKQAESSVIKYKEMTLDRVVDFKKLATKYVVSPAYYVLPPKDAPEAVKKAYALLVEALDQKGWAILTRLSVRNAKRLALISDAGRNILIAAEIEDAREVPYTPEHALVTDEERKLVTQLLNSSKDDEATFEADVDPIRELVDAKVGGEATVLIEKVAPQAKPAKNLTDLLKASIEAVSK